MACTVFLDTKTGKVIVDLSEANRAETKGDFYHFYNGDKLIAVFERAKVFGYEIRETKSPAD